MSYSENGGATMTMPVAPYGGGNGNGFFGGDGAWWLIVLLLFANNGWGNGFGGGGMGSEVQRGFDQNAVMNGLNGIAAAINNNQNAVMQNTNALAMSLQNCCCENRAGLADLKYTVATENCADRTALNEGLRDMMMANNANTQAIVNATNAGIQSVMDKICQLELDGKNAQIAELQAALNEANRRASQNDQTAQILASQAAQTAALEQYLRPTAMPAYIVQNPNCCSQNTGCGCGM